MKIAISTGMCFSLSDAAIRKLAEKKGVTIYPEKRDYDDFIYWTVPEDKWMSCSEIAPLHEWDAYMKYVQANSFDESCQRDDKDLVAVIEELGSEAASGRYTELHVVEIPDWVKWGIESNDEFGNEWVVERHRSWHYSPNGTKEYPEKTI